MKAKDILEELTLYSFPLWYCLHSSYYWLFTCLVPPFYPLCMLHESKNILSLHQIKIVGCIKTTSESTFIHPTLCTLKY